MTKINCPNCDFETSIQHQIEFKTFGCTECGGIFTTNYDNLNNFSTGNYNFKRSLIKIGTKGKIDNEEYEVISYIIKNLGWSTFSTEYTLVSESGNYIYLSECNGHWIKLKEIEDAKPESFYSFEINYKGLNYMKYDDYNCEIIFLAGFYEFKLQSLEVNAYEFIYPPYILTMDDFGGEHKYHGTHIESSEIKRIFNLNIMPSKSGVGILQPFYIDFTNTMKIFIATTIAMLVIYIFWSQSATQNVLSTSLKINDYKHKEYVSPSFEFTGGASPLKIEIETPVDNSWAYTGVSLVNEKTNEEIFAEQDIEYYHGYTDGENWTEGSTKENFTICGVEPGKYHLTFTPQVEEKLDYTYATMSTDPNIPSNKTNINSGLEMKVSAILEKTPFWNVGFCMLLLGGGLVILFILKYFFEVSRWSDSDYSPYKSEES